MDRSLIAEDRHRTDTCFNTLTLLQHSIRAEIDRGFKMKDRLWSRQLFSKLKYVFITVYGQHTDSGFIAKCSCSADTLFSISRLKHVQIAVVLHAYFVPECMSLADKCLIFIGSE